MPVAGDEAPLYQAICQYLLGSFAAALPVTRELVMVDEQPELANRAAIAQALSASYPRRLRDAGTGGASRVRAMVGEDGRVVRDSIRVLWSTRPEFAEAAVYVIGQMRFRAARQNGAPVAVWITVPVTFELSNGPPPRTETPAADGAPLQPAAAGRDATASAASTASPGDPEIPVGPRPLRVLSSSSGIVLSVDSLTLERTGDSTFRVNTLYDFPPGDTRAASAGHMEESQEMDCAGTRVRGRYTVWGDPEHPFSLVRETSPATENWQSVAEDELPIFQALCTYLLGSFAASLPVANDSAELWDVDEPPELANRADVARALSREYPRELYQQRVGGTVLVRFQITTEGRADTATARVLRASRREFGLAALEVVRAMRFRPARKGGAPVAVWATLPIAFDR
jgi:protein TonB